jgi:DNA replication and repair protein RecF
MLTHLTLRHFRCFDTLGVEFKTPTTFIVGPNAQGKTSLLEAACVLLRLRSPRTTRLGLAIQHGKHGFVLDGHFDGRHMQLYFGRERKKLALDSVEQKTSGDYTQIALVVYFGNRDMDIVRGPSETRRRFVDFVAEQIDPIHRGRLRVYETALRSRNHLLKAPNVRWRQVAAFDAPLIEAGAAISGTRRRLVEQLQPQASDAHSAISGGERLEVRYECGCGEDFAAALEAARDDDARLRQTTVGPHRDDLVFFLNGTSCDFASEGQQRTAALALRLGEATLLANQSGVFPLLLLDDIFGELDALRRNALLARLPPAAQKIVTTTNLDWMDKRTDGDLHSLCNGRLKSI